MFDIFRSSQKKSNDKEANEEFALFKRRGGSLPLYELKRYIDGIPHFQSYERGYIKAVMAKFDHSQESGATRYVTQEEFLQGLEEMRENNRDLINPEEVDRIKNYFAK